MRPGRIATGAAALLLAVSLAGPTRGAEAGRAPGGVYDEIVGRIFEVRCSECHGEQKKKGKLALHTFEALMKGSDAGPVIASGKPQQSSVVERLKLPLADEEHMPPSDRPQPGAEEVALIERWIERGAGRDTTLAELQLSPELFTAVAGLPARLAALAQTQARADPPWEYDPAAVAKARAPSAAQVAELQRRFPGALTYESRTSTALRFTASGLGRDFGDAELAALGPLRAEVIELDLSGTGITDASAKVLAGFTRLRTLRAAFTAIGDPTLAALVALPELEALTLTETRVTAAGVPALGRMSKLRVLRLADTMAEQSAREAHLPVVAGAAGLIPPLESEKKDPKP